MNLVDCYVTEVLGKPFFKHGKWWVPVKYDSYGRINETNLMLDTKAQADTVTAGHHFLA